MRKQLVTWIHKLSKDHLNPLDIENYAKTFEKLSKVSKQMKHHQTKEKTPKQPRNIITNAFFQ